MKPTKSWDIDFKDKVFFLKTKGSWYFVYTIHEGRWGDRYFQVISDTYKHIFKDFCDAN